MSKKYRTNKGKIVEAKPVEEAQGCLLNASGFIHANDVVFRIYDDDGHDDDEKTFTDYPIHHADPWIKFVDSSVYFYTDGEKSWIDHSPSALGYEEI